ncbi:hypothetical protein [Streptomyces sp. CA-106110]|uniref:hypothetical protein n=1 Tax=Streptomyces sp. CA-106110 TaxID=3240044 RepID=UPI003D93C2A8
MSARRILATLAAAALAAGGLTGITSTPASATTCLGTASLHGRSAEAAARIARQADDLGLTTERRGGVEECVRYLANKEPYLGYAQALEQGWPIATGVVEGACRRLIADRFDITGSRWSVEGAEALLLLRAVIINGDFEEYWLHHIEQEHLRTRQARHQDGYALTA